MKDESGTTLKPCPGCGWGDELSIASNSSLQISEVSCGCGHVFQSGCWEENIGRHWNRHCHEKAKGGE